MFWLVARIVVTLPPPPLGKELTGESGHSTAQHYPLVWQDGLPRKSTVLNAKEPHSYHISALNLTTAGKLTSHLLSISAQWKRKIAGFWRWLERDCCHVIVPVRVASTESGEDNSSSGQRCKPHTW